MRLSDEERKIVVDTLKARLDALQAEMTRTDSPQYSLELKREEGIIRTLIRRLRPASARRPAKAPRGTRRKGKRK